MSSGVLIGVAIAIMLGVLAWRLPGVWGDGFR